MQLHLQAVRIHQVDAKARSSDMTSKHNVTLADQTWKKKRKEKRRNGTLEWMFKWEPYVRRTKA